MNIHRSRSREGDRIRMPRCICRACRANFATQVFNTFAISISTQRQLAVTISPVEKNRQAFRIWAHARMRRLRYTRTFHNLTITRLHTCPQARFAIEITEALYAAKYRGDGTITRATGKYRPRASRCTVSTNSSVASC